MASVSYIACSSASRPVVDAAADAGVHDGAHDGTNDSPPDVPADTGALDGPDFREVVANLVPFFNEDAGSGTQGG